MIEHDPEAEFCRCNDCKMDRFAQMYGSEPSELRVAAAFSEDLHYPSNPNCKCMLCFMRKYQGQPLEPYQEELIRHLTNGTSPKISLTGRYRDRGKVDYLRMLQGMNHIIQGMGPLREQFRAFPGVTESPPRTSNVSPNLQVLPELHFEDYELMIIDDQLGKPLDFDRAAEVIAHYDLECSVFQGPYHSNDWLKDFLPKAKPADGPRGMGARRKARRAKKGKHRGNTSRRS